MYTDTFRAEKCQREFRAISCNLLFVAVKLQPIANKNKSRQMTASLIPSFARDLYKASKHNVHPIRMKKR